MRRYYDLLTQLMPGLISNMEKLTKSSAVRTSKHMLAGRNYRATKAYADDRQKAPHNRRKHGRRKQK